MSEYSLCAGSPPSGRSGGAIMLPAALNTADGYPNPPRSELKAKLRDYTRYVIDKDWPAHRKGRVPMGGEHHHDALRQTVLSFELTTRTQELRQREMRSNLNAMTMAREQPLHPAAAGAYRELGLLK